MRSGGLVEVPGRSGNAGRMNAVRGFTPAMPGECSVPFSTGAFPGIGMDASLEAMKSKLAFLIGSMAILSLTGEHPVLEGLRERAESGETEARYQLAERLRWGRGVSQDHAPAHHALGVQCSFGWGVPEDHAVAMKWFRRAAEQDYAVAC